jgi:hypothetical protein
MTLLLATVARDFAMLTADRRTQEGAERRPADGDKLIQLGGCVVACFGTSPPDVDVPVLVRAAKTDPQSHPDELARILRSKIRALKDPGDFGLLVVGSGAKDLELWEVPQGGGTPAMLEPLVLHARPASIYVASPAVLPDAQQMRDYLLSLFQNATAQCPSTIGPPFELAEFRFGQPPTVTQI